MSEVTDMERCTRELIRHILESEEYRHFCVLRDKVKEEPELRQEINDFRLHVFETQNSLEPLDMYSEQLRLSRDYEEFRKNPLVNGFLLAELRVCRMVQKITEEIVESLDLDSDEISERIRI